MHQRSPAPNGTSPTLWQTLVYRRTVLQIRLTRSQPPASAQTLAPETVRRSIHPWTHCLVWPFLGRPARKCLRLKSRRRLQSQSWRKRQISVEKRTGMGVWEASVHPESRKRVLRIRVQSAAGTRRHVPPAPRQTRWCRAQSPSQFRWRRPRSKRARGAPGRFGWRRTRQTQSRPA